MAIDGINAWNSVLNKLSLAREITKPKDFIKSLSEDCETGILCSDWLETNKIVQTQHKYGLVYKLFSEILKQKNIEEIEIPIKKLFKNLSILFKDFESIKEFKVSEKNKQIVLESLKQKNDFFSKFFLKSIFGTDLQDPEILFEAIHSNCFETVNFILQKIILNEEIITKAIFLICSNIETDAEIIKKLSSTYENQFKIKFNFECENAQFQTPLQAAYEESNINAFKVLLELGASLESKNSSGESILDLMHSCFQNSKFDPQVIELIEKEFKKNQQFSIQDTSPQT